jgi:cytosine/adenosine deaminase-related metal-dependent hydrolase
MVPSWPSIRGQNMQGYHSHRKENVMACLCQPGMSCPHRSRRLFLKSLAAAPLLTASGVSLAQAQATVSRSRNRILLKGGHVVTLDRSLGDIAGGDVLVEGSAIARVGRNLDAADAEIIDAADMVVLPGFIDSHRHTWQTALRGYLAQGNYYQIVLTQLGPLYRPEDVYIGNLLGAVGALSSGITTMLDWSHIMNSPAHADAAVQALQESGMRAVFAHGVAQVGRSSGVGGQLNSQQHSDDIRRVQREHFQSDDQLVTLAMAFGGVEFSSIEETIKDVALARELGIRLTTHVGVIPDRQAVTKMQHAGLLGPDITYVHATRCSDDEIKMIADSGGTLSSSPLNEPLPGLNQWLKHGLRPSLSLDNETRAPGDLFTQMRAMMWHDWNWPSLADGARIGYRDILEFATIEGARATGLDRKVGSLTPGKRADIVLIDRNDLAMIPHTGDPAASVVLQAQPSHVSWVLVDGKVRKRNGRLVDVDVARLQRLAQSSHDYLLQAAKLPAQS